jgi:hypothetical protein
MKKILFITSTVFLFSCNSTELTKVETNKLKQEAVAKIQSVAKVLKPQLKNAIKNGGFTHAVEFCSVQAPIIGKNANKNSDWKLKRVSLKNRNLNAIPDAWEEKVLKEFDKRQTNGESAKKMAFSEVVDGEFRFMKAQGSEKVCLQCHGKNIQAEVSAKIKQSYPNDKAINYEMGQIRGAFSLRKKL